MNPEELGRTLPNGFHDAVFKTFKVDYVSRELVIECDILIGDAGGGSYEIREGYAQGTLTLSGLQFLVIEPPDSRYSFEEGALELTSNGCVEGQEFKSTAPKLPIVPEEAFVHWFFVSNWNSLIFVSALEANFTWKE